MIEEQLKSIDDKLGVLMRQNQILIEKLTAAATQVQINTAEETPEPDELDLLGTKSTEAKQEKKVTVDDVLAAITASVTRLGGDDPAKIKVRKVLEKFGAKRGSEVKEEDAAAVVDALNKLKAK